MGFGYGAAGNLDDQMWNAVGACESGRNEITRLWGALLREAAAVFDAVEGDEDNYGDEAYSVIATINRLPALREKLAALERHVEPYRSAMELAVREHAKAQAAVKPGPPAPSAPG